MYTYIHNIYICIYVYIYTHLERPTRVSHDHNSHTFYVLTYSYVGLDSNRNHLFVWFAHCEDAQGAAPWANIIHA